MKCKWYFERDYACANSECPYRGDVCQTSEHPEVCKFAKIRYEVSELVKILRCGAGDEYKCADCAANLKNKCDRKEANRQAADMLEKLAAEKRNEHKIKTPYARIYVSGTPEKPYYGITYFDLTDGEMHSGFGSYSLDLVFKWFAEEFDVAKPEQPKEDDFNGNQDEN